MMKRLTWGVMTGALVLGLWLVPVHGQDLNTLLVAWITEWRAGTVGDVTALTSIKATDTAIATTSTDGFVATNTTAATAGVPVQMSPRMRWRGNAWDTAASQTVDFFAENLPATAATPTGTWKLGYSLNGGAASYPMTVGSGGTVTLPGSLLAAGTVRAGAAQAIQWSGRNSMYSTADGLTSIKNSVDVVGLELNVGTAAPTLANCGVAGGTLTAGSRNSAGEATPTNANTSCDVVFGAPAFTNTPFCVIEDETTATATRISAIATTGFTVAGLTGGDKFMWLCVGRI